MILKNIKKIFNIFIDTPKNFLVLFFTVTSSLLSIVGIPLLIPAINLLTKNESIQSEKLFIFYENIFNFLNIQLTFNNLVLFALVFIFVGNIVALIVELYSQKIQVKLINQYMLDLLEGYYKASWTFMNDEKSGSLHSGISRESIIVSETHLDTLRLLSSFIYLSAYLGLSFFLFSKFIYFVLIYGLLTVLPIFIITRLIKNISKKNNLTQIDLSSLITNLLTNKKFFKSSNNYFSFKEIVKDKIKFIMKSNWKMIFFEGSLRTFNILVGMIMLIIVLLAHKTLGLLISEILVLIFVFSRTVPAYISFANNFTRVFQKLPIYDSIIRRVRALRINEEKFGTRPYEENSVIKIENVSFWYKSKDESILEDINLKIEPKTTIAITGISGSGKSTLIDILLGLIKPSKGKILYNTTDHNEINYKSFREKVSYVSQNSTLIDGTINFNMRMLNKKETQDNIVRACKLAAIHETIESLPGKYEYEIGENGSKLSGGQKQRLTIARSLLNNPEIIIFDEATNQLDKETEKSVQKAIKELSGNKTIVIISHQKENFENIDQVYKIKDKKIEKV